MKLEKINLNDFGLLLAVCTGLCVNVQSWQLLDQESCKALCNHTTVYSPGNTGRVCSAAEWSARPSVDPRARRKYAALQVTNQATSPDTSNPNP